MNELQQLIFIAGTTEEDIVSDLAMLNDVYKMKKRVVGCRENEVYWYMLREYDWMLKKDYMFQSKEEDRMHGRVYRR